MCAPLKQVIFCRFRRARNRCGGSPFRSRLIKSFDEEVRVVLKGIGHYHLPMVASLVENGIFVCCVNALRMKKFCSQNLRRAKTDKIDSIKIANFGLTYRSELTPTLPKGEVYQELKLLASFTPSLNRLR
ncbi:MAG: IS110 family transposase [Lachnospiraceae bacterium]|nr:IS110 family transposase [Ruminococcus sp.]MCM1276678.1 IS110 family transposase [Lachnospiraceae bacterium]